MSVTYTPGIALAHNPHMQSEPLMEKLLGLPRDHVARTDLPLAPIAYAGMVQSGEALSALALLGAWYY